MPDTKEQATPTPRTDREIWLLEPDTNFKDSYKHMASFARQLETELAEANQRLAAMEEAADKAVSLMAEGHACHMAAKKNYSGNFTEASEVLKSALSRHAARLQQREGGK